MTIIIVTVPIEIKSSPEWVYKFRREWSSANGLVLIWVWNLHSLSACDANNTHEVPTLYIFNGLSDVEKALGDSVKTCSWTDQDGYFITYKPSKRKMTALEAFMNNWKCITDGF